MSLGRRRLPFRYSIAALLIVGGANLDGQTLTVAGSVPGVEISLKGQPAFDAAMTGLLSDPQKSSLLQPMIPFTVRITNQGSKPIIYYVLRYNRRTPEGKQLRTVVRFNYLVRGGILPGQSEFAFPIAGMAQAAQGQDALPAEVTTRVVDQRNKSLEEFRSATDLTVSVDAVVYADGELAGPDTTATATLLNSFARGMAELFRGMDQAATSAEAARQFLWEVLQRPNPFQMPPIAPGPASSMDEQEFAAGVVGANLYSRSQAAARQGLRVLETSGIDGLRAYATSNATSREFISVWRAH
jgi:hypothetical protein